jgi:hypothetical protein
MLTVAAGIAIAVGAQAQALRFNSGYVTNGNTAAVTLYGPTNMVCVIDRLGATNGTWSSVGTVTLNSYGYGFFTNLLDQWVYGVYRAIGTNAGTVYRSTNAFGAVVGDLYPGLTMVGNPFTGMYAENLVPSPADGTAIYRWNNSTTNYSTDVYDGGWSLSLWLARGEGVIVKTPTNIVSQKYVVSGVFPTNAFTYSVPKGQSILCTPLCKVTDAATWRVDLLTTNQLGGASSLPVRSTGYTPESTINRMIDLNGTYKTYTLTNNAWYSSYIGTTVPLELTEAFWLNKPTNGTWTVTVPVWW